jgi:capsule polysaccharide export protein KpsE/RkpR
MTPTMRPLDLSFLKSRASLRRIAAVTLVCAAVGVLYAVVTPKWYSSVLTVVPAKAQRSPGISSLLGSELGGLAAGLDVGGSADVARIAAVLQSVGVSDAVIDKFDLRARYGEKYPEGAREALWRHCEVKALPKPGLVQLSCEDKDPRFVQELLTFFAEHGNQVFRRIGVSAASEQVRFLEKRIAELRQQADAAGARMRAFQEQHGIVDLDTQAKALVSTMATLQGQRIAKQLELDYAHTFSSRDESTMRQLYSQLSVIDDTLRDLEVPVAPAAQPTDKRARRGGAGQSSMFPAALAIPKLRAELETIYRDRKVAEATLVFGLERLEAARAEEARDVSTFQVLDAPALPTRKSRPQRAAIVLVAALAGLGAASLREWWTKGGLTTVLLTAEEWRPGPRPAPDRGTSQGR